MTDMPDAEFAAKAYDLLKRADRLPTWTTLSRQHRIVRVGSNAWIDSGIPLNPKRDDWAVEVSLAVHIVACILVHALRKWLVMMGCTVSDFEQYTEIRHIVGDTMKTVSYPGQCNRAALLAAADVVLMKEEKGNG